MHKIISQVDRSPSIKRGNENRIICMLRNAVFSRLCRGEIFTIFGVSLYAHESWCTQLPVHACLLCPSVLHPSALLLRLFTCVAHFLFSLYCNCNAVGSLSLTALVHHKINMNKMHIKKTRLAGTASNITVLSDLPSLFPSFNDALNCWQFCQRYLHSATVSWQESSVPCFLVNIYVLLFIT